MANKVFVFGAGATKGASTVNSRLEPPVLIDLHKIFDYPFLSLNRTVDGPKIGEAFRNLLSLTNTKGDLENFFTLLQIIEDIRVRFSPGQLQLTKAQMDEMYNDLALSSYNISYEDTLKIRIIIKYFSENSKAQILNSPLNFYMFFQYALQEYMMYALNSCYCKYHAKLFKNLDDDDTVVTYNYDEVCDFTLFREHKINKKSFEGLGFSEITFPEEPINSQGVTFLKMHGSFNWWTDISVNPFKNIYYNLQSQANSGKSRGETFYRVILPFKHKSQIYNSFPIYKAHMIMLKNKLVNADEVILVGKNFNSSDKDLNMLIERWSSNTRKSLKIINLDINKGNFIEHHCKIFNAEYAFGWKSLEEFFKSSSDV